MHSEQWEKISSMEIVLVDGTIGKIVIDLFNDIMQMFHGLT